MKICSFMPCPQHAPMPVPPTCSQCVNITLGGKSSFRITKVFPVTYYEPLSFRNNFCSPWDEYISWFFDCTLKKNSTLYFLEKF